MGLFGLFGPSQSEIMHQRVNDVEVFYERMVKCFNDNIKIEEKPYGYCEMLGNKPWIWTLVNVKDLFELYPKSILNDKEYVEIEMTFLRHKFPRGLFCEPPTEVKQRIYLKVKNNTMADIQRITTDFFQILNENISIVGKKRDKYPQLHMRLVAMYYRTRGAAAWFNYLDKTSM